MNSPSAILRANPGLAVGVALCLGIILVLLLMAALMRGAGVSLRPIVFMAGLMLPISLTFMVGSMVKARVPSAAPEVTPGLAVRDGQFVDRDKLFGKALAPSDFRDAKAVFPEFFAGAEVAELGLVGTGETVLVAQFPTATAAKQVAGFLWQTFQITQSSGDEERGWRGKRRQHGDYIEMVRTGRLLFFWTGQTREAAAAHRAASVLPADVTTETSRGAAPLFPALQPLAALFQSTAVKVAGLLFLVSLYTVWFFKGAAWAGSVPSPAGVSPVAGTELAARLEAINALDVPFHVERGTAPNELFATWRYADAKLIDLARAHGLRRIFRIRLLLDETDGVVRATDYTAAYNWSAGPGEGRVEWQAGLGIVFFQREQQRVFGVQLDEQGGFKPELSYTYRFDVNEMKSPLIAAVTRAGWTWRPTVWQGPVWLRWLTE